MLRYLNNLLQDWEDPDYDGLNKIYNDKYPDHSYEELIHYKTVVDIAMTPTIKVNDKKMNEYDNDIKSFLEDYNFIQTKALDLKNPTSYRIEGSSTKQHLAEHNKYINDDTKYILEIGFNSGISAINFLENAKNAIVVSIDICLHSYCWYSKMFIDNKYPGRHILISGDSIVNTPTLSLISNIKFDVIFVDGYHSKNYAYKDIINCSSLSDDNTVLIVDNVAPHTLCGIGPYVAINELLKEGNIEFVKHIEIGDNYSDGFCILKYSTNKTPRKLSREEYIKIERKIPVRILTEYLSLKIKSESANHLKNTVNIFLKKLEKYNIEPDEGLLNMISKL